MVSLDPKLTCDSPATGDGFLETFAGGGGKACMEQSGQ